MALASGTKLGPYEITGPLGSGGMGEVYRARDSRLGRDVAIKVLPEHLSSHPEVRARFEREARTISSLNHPNICTLFDVGREANSDFLVMELVEGETLAGRIARGPLPTPEVLRIGAQIADALDRAHRAGVTHRDLKPGNVMLTKSGAKLMDFGLARRDGGVGGGPGQAALTQSPTVAAPLTAEGTVLGTFQYMAPEQLEGKEADARSDIWALGCVLYEMASGKRAFEGRSQASTIGSIMHSEPPPLAAVAPMTPPALDGLVRTCLAKDPDERWQSAGDLRRELQRISSEMSGSGAVPVVAARRRGVDRGAYGWIAAGVVALAAIVYAVGPWAKHSTPPRLVSFTIGPPEHLSLSTPAEAALSPDGRMLAFAADDSAGTSHLVVRALASLDTRVIPGTDRCSLPFWSPDSRSVAFFTDHKLRRVALDGTGAVVLCDAPSGRGGAWSEGDVIVFAPASQGPLMRVSAQGGAPVTLTSINAAKGEKSHRYPQFLPDGKHFLYGVVGQTDVIATNVASLDGGPSVEVCRGGSVARYALPGYLLYLDSGIDSPQRRLLAKRFDAGTLKTNGDAQLVLDQVKANNFGYSNVTVNSQGDLVAQQWDDPHVGLEWYDRGGRMLGTAVADLDGNSVSLNPDETRIALGGTNPRDIYTIDLKSGVATRLTFENRLVQNVLWSPDGRRIAFGRSGTATGWEARAKAADGTGPDSLLFHGPGLFTQVQCWTPDGRWLVAAVSDTTGSFDLWRIPTTGEGKPVVYQATPTQEGATSMSPDGNWIAYISTDQGTSSLYVQSYPTPGAKYEISVPKPTGALWTNHGNELIVVDEAGRVISIEVSTAGGFRQGASKVLFTVPAGAFLADYGQKSQRFLVVRQKDVRSSSVLQVVMGWSALVHEK